MSDHTILNLEATRERIMALIAMDLGFGDLISLHPRDRAVLDQQTAETIEGFSEAKIDGTDANVKLAPLLMRFRKLQQLHTDEDNTRLAEQGEVFAPENDA